MDTITAITMVCITLSKDVLMESLASLTTTISRPGSWAFRLAATLLTSFDTSMAVALCCFLMPTEMVSRPLYRATPDASFRDIPTLAISSR